MRNLSLTLCAHFTKFLGASVVFPAAEEEEEGLDGKRTRGPRSKIDYTGEA